MRDILFDLFRDQASDPIEAARQGMRPMLPVRFYRAAHVGEAGQQFAPLLDGKPIRTPGRQLLAVPTRVLAQALAAEWDRQGERLDPIRMPLTRLANSIIDGVQAAAEPVRAEIIKYLGSDLVFYRAGRPRGLVARQAELWNPIVDWAHEALGARFVLTQGVTFTSQPKSALAQVRAAIPTDPWRVGALHAITTLTGSALIAVAILDGRLTIEAAWAAAHVDEDWNMAQWGSDEVVLERRRLRLAELEAAALLLRTIAP